MFLSNSLDYLKVSLNRLSSLFKLLKKVLFKFVPYIRDNNPTIYTNSRERYSKSDSLRLLKDFVSNLESQVISNSLNNYGNGSGSNT